MFCSFKNIIKPIIVAIIYILPKREWQNESRTLRWIRLG